MLHLDLRFVTGGSRAATIASSKTFLSCSRIAMSSCLEGREYIALDKGGHGKKLGGEELRQRKWTHPLLGQGGALDILDGSELSRQSLSRLRGNRPLLLSGQLLEHRGVVPQIDLRSHDETWHPRTMVVDLDARKRRVRMGSGR
jgi:hypothetical protein